MPKIDLPVIYNQMDSRWSYILLGFNTQQPYNFYNFACLISCLAMLARYYGKDYDPVKINDSFKAMGANKAFQAGSGNYIVGGFHLLFGDISEKRTMTPSALTDGQIGEIKTSIDNGHPVMIQLDVNPKTIANETHFVLVVGYNPNDENDFTIADPIGGKIRSLKDYLGWYRPSARSTIEQYTLFTGPKPQVTPEMIVVTKDHYELYMRNHDKWHELTHYLDANLNPNITSFDQLKSIIAGLKSRTTDMENKARDLEGKLAIASTEVLNRTEQVSRLERQLLDQEKKFKAQQDALIATMPDTSKLRGEYEGQLKAKQGEIDEANKAKGKVLLDLAKCQADQKDVKKANGLMEKLTNLLQRIFPQG